MVMAPDHYIAEPAEMPKFGGRVGHNINRFSTPVAVFSILVIFWEGHCVLRWVLCGHHKGIKMKQ